MGETMRVAVMQKAGTRTRGCLEPVPGRRLRERGQTMLEFALVLPCLMLLSVGIVEIGRAIYNTIEVNNAATAGVEYGAQSSQTGVDTAGMQDAAIADGNFPGMTATAVYGCTCDTGAGTSCTYPVPPTSSCATFCGGQIIQCVQVRTHTSFNAIFHYPGLPASYTADGHAVMRVRR